MNAQEVEAVRQIGHEFAGLMRAHRSRVVSFLVNTKRINVTNKRLEELTEHVYDQVTDVMRDDAELLIAWVQEALAEGE